MSEDKKNRSKYSTTKWTQYNAALKARGSLTVWLDRDMQWLGSPSGKHGRSQTFSDSAIQFCLSIKCLVGQLLKRVQLTYKPSAQPLHLLVEQHGDQVLGRRRMQAQEARS
jgi:hypothetical protein